jgi:ribosomal protein S18 acetylase RimI-like enzyme
MSLFPIRRLDAPSDTQVSELAELLVDTVADDVSVSFLHPLSHDRAIAFWRGVADDVRAGKRALLVAEDREGICGTVQLGLAMLENQPHGAAVSKLLVHSRARRQGLGEALMRRAEAVAVECGKTLLLLNTATEEAQRLYERLGWKRAGVIPGFSLAPRGRTLRDSTMYYRELGATEAR